MFECKCECIYLFLLTVSMSAEVKVKLGNTLCRCLDRKFAALNVCQLCCVCGFISVLIIKVGNIITWLDRLTVDFFRGNIRWKHFCVLDN